MHRVTGVLAYVTSGMMDPCQIYSRYLQSYSAESRCRLLANRAGDDKVIYRHRHDQHNNHNKATTDINNLLR